MRYRLLGRSGLRVSELALGTMTFGPEWGTGASAEESRRMFDVYAEAGGNFLDTANRYTEGTSEKIVGECVASDRDHWVVATKYSLFSRKGDPNLSGNHRKNLVQSLSASLKRLNLEYVDLLWVHAWDFTTGLDEIMRGLDDVVRQGQALYIGISDTPAWIVSQANMLADLRGWTPFSALQLRYSLIDRTPERDLLPMARALDLAVTPWSVLAAGVLSGKYNGENPNATGRARDGAAKVDRNRKIAQVVVDIAAELGHAPSQVAIRWAMQQPGVVIPIVGSRSADQLKANLGAASIVLGPDHLRRLDEASAIELGFPHDFLGQDAMRDLIYGGTQGQLDPHRGLLKKG